MRSTALFHEDRRRDLRRHRRYGGSISAEHGIGKVKQQAFLKRADPMWRLILRPDQGRARSKGHIMSEGRILPRRNVRGR
jgi:hypothetical protein